jgi:hypothetical protein
MGLVFVGFENVNSLRIEETLTPAVGGQQPAGIFPDCSICQKRVNL